MNMIYGIFYLIIVIGYPFIILYVFCKYRNQLDKKQFRDFVAGPFDQMKKLHKKRNIFYVLYYIARRFFFLVVVVIYE